MLEELLQRRPGSAEIRLTYGLVLASGGDTERGLAETRRVIADRPDQPLAHYNLSRILAKEKQFSDAREALAAQRRDLPWVRIDKPYVFDGPHGKPSLKDLFEGQRQLIVYHFMFDPTWDKGCTGCTGLVDALEWQGAWGGV